MGQLKDYKPRSETVTLSDGFELTVRGLSLSDLSPILGKFEPELESVYVKYLTESGESGEAEVLPPEDSIAGKLGKKGRKPKAPASAEDQGTTITDFVKGIVVSAPLLVATIIATANDSPDDVESASRIPAPDQIQLLIAIGRLTFGSEDQIKNLVEAILTGVESLTDALETLGKSDPKA